MSITMKEKGLLHVAVFSWTLETYDVTLIFTIYNGL
jgi:hypothetical protein